jgi:uncharacterized protein
MSLPLLGLGGALAIGIALGLLGSGGSIVTVPVLVYLFAEADKQAIAGSLAVVGVVATFGAVIHARAGSFAPKVAATFAPAGMLGAWGGAAASQYVSGRVQLATFAVAMLGAALLMLYPPRMVSADGSLAATGMGQTPYGRLLVSGLAVGLLTGFVGVGGGFLIVPALVLGSGLEMHRAVGTSLIIIALTACVGFAQQLSLLTQEGLGLDYSVLSVVAGLGIAGTYLGQRFGSYLPAATLRRTFGAALVLLAAFMLWQTLHAAAAT